MDNINNVLRLAKKNRKEAQKQIKHTNVYSTEVKKRPSQPEKRVDPSAVLKFKQKQKDEQKRQEEEERLKKANLLMMREQNGKGPKKATSNPYKERQSNGSNGGVYLNDEQDRAHKKFMNKILKGDRRKADEYGGERRSSPQLVKKKKKKKRRKPDPAGMNFQELLDMAAKNGGKTVSGESSSSGESCSDDSSDEDDSHMSAKYKEERRKRKELEERIRMLEGGGGTNGSTIKRKSDGGGGEVPFKIGKLNNTILSREEKMAKIRAISSRIDKGVNLKPIPPRSSSSSQYRPSTSANHKHSYNNVLDRRKEMKRREAKPPAALVQLKKQMELKKIDDEKVKQNSAQDNDFEKRYQEMAQERKRQKEGRGDQKDSPKKQHYTSNPYMKKVPPKKKLSSDQIREVAKRNIASNPYKDLLDKAKSNASKQASSSGGKPKCTLSVRSETVRTNYPGVAQTDPKNTVYKNIDPKKVRGFGRDSSVKEYQRRAMAAAKGNPVDIYAGRRRMMPPVPPQYEYDDDDEYDSDMEGFIEDEGEEVNVSSAIKAIFGYDRSKYARESEYDLARMDASYKDIEREEKRSQRIAREEDAREARLEEMRLKKKKR